ncbi:hypothetical protein RFI_12756 [Reticulomyxa filosa]|uniref:Piezo non-specific cation channel cap domain-containing protein n=1 Tax=Reticulomyxa filosa TaxID=46433 RepID=X6NFA2_RETFI|nr:hypothetical protein RFI_12756 [Reticulomyxa filosa]|eukprot:ETO24399.1 hypothetical protein RFI_12756 [Reticulomyxa filosa]
MYIIFFFVKKEKNKLIKKNKIGNSVPQFGDLNLLTLSNYEFPTGVGLPDTLRPSFSSNSQIFQNVTFQEDGDSIWTIPSPIRENVARVLLNTSLQDTLSTQIVLNYVFTRQGPTSNNPIESSQQLAPFLTGAEARDLGEVLIGKKSSWAAPKPLAVWLSLPASGSISIFSSSRKYNVTLELLPDIDIITNSSGNDYYWSVTMSVPVDVGDKDSSYYNAPLSFLLVSDNFVSSSILSGLGISSYSVVGFYVIVVYSFSQLLRLLYSDKMKNIIFTDLQNVDYLLRLVSAVKLARKQRNFFVEELLYRRLIRIYRDPSLLITLTRRLSEEEQSSLALDGYTDTSEDDPNRLGYLLKDRAPKYDKPIDDDHLPKKQ